MGACDRPPPSLRPRRFWELDGDHDFLLSRADLARLNSLTNIVLDREPADTHGGEGEHFV
jgi:hypothetical protein